MVSLQREAEVKSNPNIPVFKPSTTNIHQSAKRLWMFSVNIYDLMGLLDICPCATLHSIQPYISYKLKN
ncbi:hypothetical protein QE152_g15410 [Popillia japonica]|uniref:Uncharacterized protein n=1 Tax=Popillia japonica TaxID=7064 RepID=A0AAW1L957_POPJA